MTGVFLLGLIIGVFFTLLVLFIFASMIINDNGGDNDE